MTQDEFDVAGYKYLATQESARADAATKKNFQMLAMGFLAGAASVATVWSLVW